MEARGAAGAKVVTDTTLDPDRWTLSTKGHSEWTLRSAATPADRWTFLPLINLGYDIDTDLAGAVHGGGCRWGSTPST